MPTDTILTALKREDALCDQALSGFSEWLGQASRIPLRHPLTACCSVILRHIDVEENIIFPRLLIRAPDHASLIESLRDEHLTIRNQLQDIESLVISNQRREARQALNTLRTLLSDHSHREAGELFTAITECLTDPNEIGHLFHSGYLRGEYDPSAAIHLATASK